MQHHQVVDVMGDEKPTHLRRGEKLFLILGVGQSEFIGDDSVIPSRSGEAQKWTRNIVVQVETRHRGNRSLESRVVEDDARINHPMVSLIVGNGGLNSLKWEIVISRRRRNIAAVSLPAPDERPQLDAPALQAGLVWGV